MSKKVERKQVEFVCTDPEKAAKLAILLSEVTFGVRVKSEYHWDVKARRYVVSVIVGNWAVESVEEEEEE